MKKQKTNWLLKLARMKERKGTFGALNQTKFPTQPSLPKKHDCTILQNSNYQVSFFNISPIGHKIANNSRTITQLTDNLSYIHTNSVNKHTNLLNIRVNLSKVHMNLSNIRVNLSKVHMNVSKIHVNVSNIRVNLPKIHMNFWKIRVNVSRIHMNFTNIRAKLSNILINIPYIGINIAEIEKPIHHIIKQINPKKNMLANEDILSFIFSPISSIPELVHPPETKYIPNINTLKFNIYVTSLF